jgi:hypothetical protein
MVFGIIPECRRLPSAARVELHQNLPMWVVRPPFLSLLNRTALPLLILIGALVLRTASLRKIPEGYDEAITRAVVTNIWRGDLRNNWKYAAVPPQHRIDSYNFSSYMYADALFAGPPRHNSLHLDRWFSALTGTAAIYLFYLLALRLFGLKVGLVSLAIMAVVPLLVQDSHYARPESFVTLLCAAAYLFSARLFSSRGRLSFLAASSFCCGLLIACKISLAPMAAIPLICLAKQKEINLRSASVWIGFTVAGTFAGVPDAFFHPLAFWNGVQNLRHQYAGAHVPHALMNASTSFPLMALYFWQTLGPAFCVSCVLGMLALLLRRQYFEFVFLALPAIFYLLFFSLQRTFFERNLSHVVPLMAILSGLGLIFASDVTRGRARAAAFAVLLVFVLLQPAQISAKLVFVAMRTTYEERTKDYEKALSRTQGLPVAATSSLLATSQVQRLAEMAIASQGDILVRIYDFNDAFTKKFLHDLKRCANARQVGYVPSLFPDFWVNTILTYHAPAFRYIRLSPPAQLQVKGLTFVPWRRVVEPLTAAAIRPGSWAENGVYPGVKTPAVSDRFFGSYTNAAKDGNRGVIQMGPFDVDGLTEIGIPIVTGPVTTGLSVSVLDHKTGSTIVQIRAFPVLPEWTVWRIELGSTTIRQIDLTGEDGGAGWGQWLGLGLPVKLAGGSHHNAN